MKFYPIPEALDSRGDENMAIREFLSDGHILSSAFVREFFQNALDAVDNKSNKVKVKIRIVEISKESDKKYIEATYTDALDLLRLTGTSPIQNHKYLVIEEFNTIGLTGTDMFRPAEKDLNKSHWSNFSFGMLRQSKEGDSGGRNGVGKIMLNLLSGLRTVIYKTKRSTDGKDWIGGRMEFNKSAEVGNSSNKIRFSNWAWLSPYSGDSALNLSDEDKLNKLYKPTTSQKELDKLDEIFNITREEDEYGTTWIIPSPLEKNSLKEEVHELENLDSMVSKTIDDFSWALMNDFLEVDFDGFVVNSENVIEILNLRFPEKNHLWNFLDDIRSFPDSNLLDVNTLWQDMNDNNLLNSDIFDANSIKKQSNDFNLNKLVGFSFPITISKQNNPGDPTKRNSTKKIETSLKVFLKNLDTELSKTEELFLRKWLIISKEKSLLISSKVLAVTLIDDLDLSEFCAYAEVTDHSKFNASKRTLTERYTNTNRTLRKIRRAARTAFQTLNVSDNEKYENVLADILGVSTVSGIKRKTKRKKKKTLVTPNPNPVPKNQRFIKLSESFEPLILEPGNDSLSEEDCPITITLNCSTVGLLGGVKDFDISEEGFLGSNLSAVNCVPQVINNGSLCVEIKKPDFKLEINNFKTRFHTSISIKY